MKIIEGMKKLRIIEKRMDQNRLRITQYASIVSTDRPLFKSEADQSREVENLIKANTDLGKEYLKLKRAIDQTNLSTLVSINGDNWYLSDLLVYKRKIYGEMASTYAALNDSAASIRLRSAPVIEGKSPRIERMYTEHLKNDGLKHWQDISETFEQRLEVINATTELVGLVE